MLWEWDNVIGVRGLIHLQGPESYGDTTTQPGLSAKSTCKDLNAMGT